MKIAQRFLSKRWPIKVNKVELTLSNGRVERLMRLVEENYFYEDDDDYYYLTLV